MTPKRRLFQDGGVCSVQQYICALGRHGNYGNTAIEDASRYRWYDKGEYSASEPLLEAIISQGAVEVFGLVEEEAPLFEIKDRMFDSRSESHSLLVNMAVKEYIALTWHAHAFQGKLAGQRDRLGTTSALRIRRRMVEDLIQGAILPPVVIGLLVDEAEFQLAETWDDQTLKAKLYEHAWTNLSIIDGMQRTQAIMEHQGKLQASRLRVEVWVAKETASLTYRMLVLNTGQIPWNLRRQIEVVYSALLTELEARLSGDVRQFVKFFRLDDNRRRLRSGEFQANQVIEMYIAFGLRKPKVDTDSVLADEFSRLDMIDAVSNREFLVLFTMVFSYLCRLDLAFEKVTLPVSSGRFNIGRHLFDSQPACVGFVTAAAQSIFGRPGTTRDQDRRGRAVESIFSRCEELLARIESMSAEDMAQFLSFDTLNEVLGNRSTAKIGDFERDYFTEAFRVFFSEDDLSSMIPCWRAF